MIAWAIEAAPTIRQEMQGLTGVTGINDLLHNSVQVPPVGDAPQLVLAGVLEGKAGAGGQVLHGLRHENLIWAS